MTDKLETTVPGAIAFHKILDGADPHNWSREYKSRATLEQARAEIIEVSRIWRGRSHQVHVVITVDGPDLADRLVPGHAPNMHDRRVQESLDQGGTFTEVRQRIEPDSSKWPKT